jgi:hypothetical protein
MLRSYTLIHCKHCIGLMLNLELCDAHGPKQHQVSNLASVISGEIRDRNSLDCHSTTTCSSASWSSQRSGCQGYAPLSRQSVCPGAGPSIHIRNQHLNALSLSTGRSTLLNPYPTTSSVAGGGNRDIRTYHYHTWGPTSQNDGARRLPNGEPDIRDHGRWRCTRVI